MSSLPCGLDSLQSLYGMTAVGHVRNDSDGDILKSFCCHCVQDCTQSNGKDSDLAVGSLPCGLDSVQSLYGMTVMAIFSNLFAVIAYRTVRNLMAGIAISLLAHFPVGWIPYNPCTE